MVKKKPTKRKTVKVILKTKQGSLIGFTKLPNKKLAFLFRKNGKRVLGKSRFKNQTSLKKRFVSMLRKKQKR